ncbi:PR-1-like protein [Lentinus tigrinus ALCF2SS1-7]|uniref:PR-1-like protein n=1 Tax=Lentinus tigrinus ALCF2SS1-7 TaxID=1328758 RepID=UPI0011662E09|nr:PR-1-like protein [Lentinus tigrinus ALCF2SS1-7]
MNRLVYFLFTLPLLLSFITSAHAGPACARRNQGMDSCIELCKQKWGWPGFVMGTDRWGSVMTVTKTNDMGAVVTQACRVRSSASGALGSATTSIASNTSIPLSTQTQRALSTGSSSLAPANVIQTASVSTVTSASFAPFASNSSSFSIGLLNTTKTSTKKASSTSSKKPTAFVTSTKPATTSTTPKTTSTHETTSTPPPAPSTTQEKPTTTTPKTTQAKTTTSKQATSTQSSGNSGSSSDATSQSDIDAYLQAHNSIRAQHGASPLSWSDNLASAAQGWANNCVFQHSGGKLGAFGENLAAGTGSSYGIGPAVKSWTDEVSDYDPSNPEASHFTQVVWKGSTQVGCAVQSCSGIFDASFGPAKFFVCEYFPQGNIIGEFAQNVQK